MSSLSFVGSKGLMDVTAPSWLIEDETLFGQWGQLLIALIKHGTLESVRKGKTMDLGPNDIALLIDGGLYVTDMPVGDDGRTLLIDIIKRGDLFTSSFAHNLKPTLTAQALSRCLIVRESALEMFKADFDQWDRILSMVNVWMAQAYLQAVSQSFGRDQDRIRRVLSMMANHPTALDSRIGREIEAGKQLIRDLAGVQKRSATRAFRTLEENGEVCFYGYKRLFVKA
jgi:hypothetical protein